MEKINCLLFLGMITLLTACDREIFIEHQIENLAEEALQITYSYEDYDNLPATQVDSMLTTNCGISILFIEEFISNKVGEPTLVRVNINEIKRLSDNALSTKDPTNIDNWTYDKTSKTTANMIYTINASDF